MFSLRNLIVVSSLLATESALSPVASLPGYNGPLPKMYAGYVNYTSPILKSRHFTHTWVVESSLGPTAPIIYWFQGGPGCSGYFGSGFEHGAVYATSTPNASTGALIPNPFSWHTLATVVYFEQPVGVGFSYSENPADYGMLNDTISAADNYAWIQAFLAEMPQYTTQPMWLVGESYGGNYIPQVAYNILTGPNTAIAQQLTGVMIGNPVLSCPDNFLNVVDAVQADILFHHALIPQTVRDDYVTQGCAELAPKDPQLCNTLLMDMFSLMGDVNPDDMWSNEAYGGNGTLGLYAGPQAVDRDENWGYYLNRADVQAAIFAKKPVFPPWNDCVMAPEWNYDANFPSNLPQYAALFDAGKQVLIYSGDVDVATCPFAGTQYCLTQMNRPVVAAWTPWTVSGQQAGYIQQYDTMTFATVKGGGHEAPGYQPWASYEMINRFMSSGALIEQPQAQAQEEEQQRDKGANTGRAMNGRFAQSQRLRMTMAKARKAVSGRSAE